MQNRNKTEDFLQRFHTRYPGATAKVFACGEVFTGINSYDLLIHDIPNTASLLTVVDLACGDGYLIEKLCKCKGEKLRLVGLDMCLAELNAAQKRLIPCQVTFLCQRAQQMSIDDLSVDYVLCHMGLMLMEPVSDVIQEVRRVLKPGGMFSAIVAGELQHGDAYDLFLQVLKKSFLHDGVELRSRLGDPRVKSIDGIRSLFCETTGFSDLTVKDFVLKLETTPEKLCDILSLSYDVELLSINGKKKLRQEFLTKLKAATSSNNLVSCSIGLRKITTFSTS